MRIAIIAAVSRNRVIGKNQKIPWQIPADLKLFREKTRGSSVIAGRLTFLSIIKAIGKPLPVRTNYVVSSSLDYEHDDVVVVPNIVTAIKMCKELQKKKVFVIGGQRIYKEALALADEMLLTHINIEVENGDTFFPEFDQNNWIVVHGEKMTDEKSGIEFYFSTYTRKERGGQDGTGIC